jgi:hypothetical protein
MIFDDICVPVGTGANIVARLTSYTPETPEDDSEIYWTFFSVQHGNKMDDIYPLFKRQVLRDIDNALWNELNILFDSDPALAYESWSRNANISS